MNIANNELWVKTNDGSLAEMYDATGFEQTLIGGTLNSDGWTVFTFDGPLTKIGDSAFYNKTNITDVVIPDSVTTIGESAFEYCQIRMIWINATTAPTVHPKTFRYTRYYNGNLVYPKGSDYSQWLSKDLYYLGYYGWEAVEFDPEAPSIPYTNQLLVRQISRLPIYIYQHTDSETIVISGVLNSDGWTVFTFDEPLTRLENVSFNTDRITDVICPDTLQVIGNAVFYHQDELSGVTLSSQLTEIGNQAFDSCPKLTQINLPSSLRYIRFRAFAISSLKSVVIPGSVETIEEEAFVQCQSLSSVTMNHGVKTIGEKAFESCPALTYLQLPETLLTISLCAFRYCTALSSINIPNSVLTIGEQAFYGCNSATALTLGNSLTSIGNSAFNSCSGLTGELVIPDSVTYLGQGAFSSCESITHVTIGTGLTSIKPHTFYMNYSLTNVVIPSTVTEIDSYAFAHCYHLSKIVLPASIITLGSSVFQHCQELKTLITTATIAPHVSQTTFNNVPTGGTLYYPEGSDYSQWLSTDPYYLGYYGWNGVAYDPANPDIPVDPDEPDTPTDPDIPDEPDTPDTGDTPTIETHQLWVKTASGNVADIYDTYFEQNLLGTTTNPEGYTVFIFDAPLTSIGMSAFTSTDITEVIMPSTVIGIGYAAFKNCSSLTGITLHEGITNVDAYAFQGCSSITSIDIPNSVTYLGQYAFQNCTSLVTATIGSGLTELDTYLFQGCSKLSRIDIPENITKVRDFAFGKCRNMKEVTMGGSVASIGRYSFDGCKSLSSITISTVVAPSIDSGTFNSVMSGGTLYYPIGSDYSQWLSTEQYYLGYYGWNAVEFDPNPTEPDNPDDPDIDDGTPRIIVENSLMNYTFDGGEQVLVVTYKNIENVSAPAISGDWAATTNIETLNLDEGVSRYRYTIAATKSSMSVDRTSDIQFIGDSVTKTVPANQNANLITSPLLTINKTEEEIDAKGGVTTVLVTYRSAQAVYEPTRFANWIEVETVQENTDSDPQSFLYKLTVPRTEYQRNGTVEFRFMGNDDKIYSRTFTINQREPEIISTEVHDNYIGVFKDIEENIYEVSLVTDETSDDYQEILMEGDEPFTVSYTSNDTMFEPILKSTATIGIVHNTYLENLLTPYAQGTKVTLTKNGRLEWMGYLTPKVYDQDWTNEYEIFQLEASDCICVLQYLDYEEINKRGLVSFRQILDSIITRAGLDGFYWPQSKIVDGSYLYPDHIGVYEQNFYSDDTDEPWTLMEVLEEICRYLGLTCAQKGSDIYLMDYTDYKAQGSGNSKYDYYTPSGVFRSYWAMGMDEKTVRSEDFRSNDGSISFTPIWNKVVVKDNLYNCEELVPSIFDDRYLTNCQGDFYHTYEVEPVTPYKALYPHGSGWGKQKYAEDVPDKDHKGDEEYRYFLRIYDHKYWETVYDGTTTIWGGDPVMLLKNQTQGRIVDMGTVKDVYYSLGQKIVPNSVDYERYLCIPTKHSDTQDNTGKVVFRLKDDFKMPCMVSDDAFLVVQCSVLWERYNGRPYINPDWTNEASKLHLSNGSSSWDRVAKPRFRLVVGDKAWSSFRQRWVDLGDSHDYFEPVLEWQEKNLNYWNKELSILNQVSWENNVNEAGYMIPLSGIDLTQKVRFEVLCPEPSCYGRDKNGNYFMRKYNAYCWIKDLAVKIVEKGQDVEKQDNDIVYENVIDENSISEMHEVDFRLTTRTELTKPSYSNVVLMRDGAPKFMETIMDRGLGSSGQNAEENHIERYVRQYTTKTKQLTLTLDNTVGITTPYRCLNVGYIPVGSDIDYKYARQTITLEQLK